jgi:hypothetical protein
LGSRGYLQVTTAVRRFAATPSPQEANRQYQGARRWRVAENVHRHVDVQPVPAVNSAVLLAVIPKAISFVAAAAAAEGVSRWLWRPDAQGGAQGKDELGGLTRFRRHDAATG